MLIPSSVFEKRYQLATVLPQYIRRVIDHATTIVNECVFLIGAYRLDDLLDCGKSIFGRGAMLVVDGGCLYGRIREVVLGKRHQMLLFPEKMDQIVFR